MTLLFGFLHLTSFLTTQFANIWSILLLAKMLELSKKKQKHRHQKHVYIGLVSKKQIKKETWMNSLFHDDRAINGHLPVCQTSANHRDNPLLFIHFLT